MRRLGALVLAATALGSPARAQCATSFLLEVPLGATTFYYDDRSELMFPLGVLCGPVLKCPDGGPWIYEEANGSEGLQRGGTSWLIPDDAEICIESNTPDKLWL